MRSTGPSTNLPKRRALHERNPSQTNEGSPPASLRATSDNYAGHEERDLYSVTPYPTKPEQILLPRPGKGHEFIPDSRFHVDEAPDHYGGNTSTELSQIADSSFFHRSASDPWDLSSTFDAANTPSQVWEDDPLSSKSSFPDLLPPEDKPIDPKSDSASVAAYSDEEPNALPQVPPTIKPVISRTTSRHPSGPETLGSSNSSPNVVPIGPPSSPNFVALDNSSLNFVRLGASSNPGSVTRSNSLSSLNSLGTVIRYIGAAQWTHGSSSEQSSSLSRSRSQSFRSNPSNQVHLVQSNSTLPRGRSHSRSLTSSSRSGPNSDIQAIVDSGVFLQYPTIRAPSSSSSRVDVSNAEAVVEPNPQETTTDFSSDRFKSHLSTVTSRWSAECDSNYAEGSSNNSLAEPRRPSPALVRPKPTSSSVWLVNEVDDSEGDEQQDNVANLPARPSNPAVPSSLSSGSRSRRSSVRSTKRPGTGSSIHNILPNWARMYYGRSEAQAANLGLPPVEGSRPPSVRPATASTNGALYRMPTAHSHTRTMTSDLRSVRWEAPPNDPRDPRSHWVKDPELERRDTSRNRLRSSWSPHLLPDRRATGPRKGTWGAPSLDSRMEPLFGRRNIQVWSFCVGFIFPLAWLIASFLPLPKQPEMAMQEDIESQLETSLRMRLFDLQRRRYENARWWRKLNRWMNPLGLAIITIVITLAVVGTTVGF